MCKQDKNKSKPLDRQPTVSLERVLKEVSKGVVHPDLASTIGAKISRLAGNRSEAWHNDVEKQTDGQPVSKLISTLFDSVDADKNRELAASKFNVSTEEVTDVQLDEVEAEQVKAALLPFHNPKLREILLRPEHQVIDKFTRDALVAPPSFDPEAKQRAETLVTSFGQRGTQYLPLGAEFAGTAIVGNPSIYCNFGPSTWDKMPVVSDSPGSDRYNQTVDYFRSFNLGL